jgi:predicted transcriptional regulator
MENRKNALMFLMETDKKYKDINSELEARLKEVNNALAHKISKCAH